jgi:hypothetical protein
VHGIANKCCVQRVQVRTAPQSLGFLSNTKSATQLLSITLTPPRYVKTLSARKDICNSIIVALYSPQVKGKPVVRRGRKASGLESLIGLLKTAGLPAERYIISGVRRQFIRCYS